jgi:hypothetical protein
MKISEWIQKQIDRYFENIKAGVEKDFKKEERKHGNRVQ